LGLAESFTGPIWPDADTPGMLTPRFTGPNWVFVWIPLGSMFTCIGWLFVGFMGCFCGCIFICWNCCCWCIGICCCCSGMKPTCCCCCCCCCCCIGIPFCCTGIPFCCSGIAPCCIVMCIPMPPATAAGCPTTASCCCCCCSSIPSC